MTRPISPLQSSSPFTPALALYNVLADQQEYGVKSSIEDRLHRDVEILTGVTPPRNYQNPESLKAVARHIQREFENMGLLTLTQRWQVNGETYINVRAIYNPSGTKTLVIGAHYDVCGNQPGADDNASGVAGMLELARTIASEQPDLDHRLEFVAYCLEEPPFFGTEEMGSHIHAKSLHEEGVDVIGVINLDMIGYFGTGPQSDLEENANSAVDPSQEKPTILVAGIKQFEAFNKWVGDRMAEDGGVIVQQDDYAGSLSLAGLSDQRSYWPFGYPALMIHNTTDQINPNYHSVHDTIHTLDFKKMAKVVKSIYGAAIAPSPEFSHPSLRVEAPRSSYYQDVA